MVSRMAMPTTIWSRPMRTQKTTMKRETRHAGDDGGQEAEPGRPAVVGGVEAGVGAEEHHALEADVEQAGLLRDGLAERREEERHAGEDGAGDERRR